ncbi:MAG: glycosyltransferase [Deltaproteobacteria bacterium]|nr:glycosyltransferase [Deltaproteobacteria bacterium]
MEPIYPCVVIATRPGRQPLLARAMSSLRAQSLSASHIVIVVDPDDLSMPIKAWVNDYPEAEVLLNRRMRGAAGAWNTGLDHLLRHGHEPERLFVSFLDDDDHWAPGYLKAVIVAAEHGADVVAGAIVRHDAESPEGRRREPPAFLQARDFLVGNPGIQGSNLSARLTTLLGAGLFNEALRSCTDRDLCIRLADLGVVYVAAPDAVAHHDTLHGHARLTDANGGAKLAGLRTFLHIYEPRMTSEEAAGFHARCGAYFGLQVERLAAAPAVAPVRYAAPSEPLKMVVGLIADAGAEDRVQALIADLARLRLHRGVADLRVVVVFNGPLEGRDRLAAFARDHGLRVYPVQKQDELGAMAVCGLVAADLEGRKTIAAARSILQHFARAAAEAAGADVTWILDDDMRLSDDLDDLLGRVHAARAHGDVVIGAIARAAPVPGLALLRTQLVDTLAFAHAAAVAGRDATLWDASAHNSAWMHDRRDWYYDLARSETDRLETPFLVDLPGQTVAHALRWLGTNVDLLLEGVPITRSLPADNAEVASNVREFYFRGGNTLVFRSELLDEPNLSPRVGGRFTRRSDMFWARGCAARRGARVVRAPITAEQVRGTKRSTVTSEALAQSVVDDILGYAFYRAAEASIDDGAAAVEARSARAIKRARKYVLERLAAFRLSRHRVRGCLRALQRLFSPGGADVWWHSDPAIMADWQRALARLSAAASIEVDAMVEAGCLRGLDDNDFATFLEGWHAPDVRPRGVSSVAIAWVAREQRVERAFELARAHGESPTSVLGVGAEGVVLQDGTQVFKVFDGWSAEERERHRSLLAGIVGLASDGALPRLSAVRDWDGVPVAVYPFEPTTAYRGGCGPDIVRLLRGLRTAGLVHTNIRPENLRTSHAGLLLVDIGRSLEKWSRLGHERMIQRAFLSWRYAFRADLQDLMRRALSDPALPELAGWESLLSAIDDSDAKHRLDEHVHALVEGLHPRSYLDFGCGKPRTWPALLPGASAVAYDPESSLEDAWAAKLPAVRFWNQGGLAQAITRGETFEVVLASLVLCAVPDEEARAALQALRQLVTLGGNVVVAICDPTARGVARSVGQRRQEVPPSGYECPHRYEKHVGGAATARHEYHRPVSWWHRELGRAGFRVVEESAIDGIDANRFELVSEFLVWRLAPLPHLPKKTSLLIKVCALEAATVAAQVRHLVRQLGAPRAFDEVVVVADPHPGPYPRAHTDGDLPRLMRELDRLREAQIVDRVLLGPADGDSARPINRRWFGLDSPATRATNGQPAPGILAAIEACTGDLVLQVDVDVIVARPKPHDDLSASAADVFGAHSDIVTLSLPVYGDEDPQVRFADERGPFRVESRAAWVHRDRLLALRPLPAGTADDRLAAPWHRMLDAVVRDGRAQSARRGSTSHWFACPDNGRKRDVDGHMLLLDRIEAGCVSPVHRRNSDLLGSLPTWLGPPREEPLVLIVCGRDVGPGRVRRCLDSVTSQSFADWGLVVVDDASTDGTADVLARELRRIGERATLIRRHRSLGQLANVILAVRHLIARPDAVVALLDLDDALIGRDALELVMRAYASGGDVTVGSMLRSDKAVTYAVDFEAPRERRGGNVWQHLRTFRRSLFDRIEVEDLLDGDAPFAIASDWAMMLPIVEMASRPVHLPQPIYFHEPGVPRSDERRATREATIARITSRPTYRGRRVCTDLVVLAYHRVLPVAARDDLARVHARRGLVVSAGTFEAQLVEALRTRTIVSLDDVAAAHANARTLPRAPLLVTFDDGFRDFAEVAVPILARLGVPSVCFARTPDADDLPTIAPLDLFYAAIAGATPPRVIDRAWREHLLRPPIGAQLDEVRRAGDFRGEAAELRRQLYLSGAEIATLGSADVAIGAHGIEHERWTNLSPPQLGATLTRAAAWLRRVQPTGPLAAAYPDGAVDAAVAAAMAAAGFELGFGLTVQPDGAAARYAVRRVIVPDDVAAFDAILHEAAP